MVTTKLPSANDFGRANPQGSQRAIVQIDSTMQGKALEGVGDTIFRLGVNAQREQEIELEQQKRNDTELQQATANANLTNEIGKILQEFDADSDYATQPERFSKLSSVKIAEISNQITDEHARKVWQQRAKQQIFNQKMQVYSRAQAKKRDMSVASLDNAQVEGLSATQTLGRDALTPVIQMIDMNYRAGNISAQDAERRKRSLYESYGINEIANKSPEERIAILSGKAGVIPLQTKDPVLDEAIQIAAMEDEDWVAEFLTRTAILENGGKVYGVNPASGAAGAFQLMPATARELGVTNPQDPLQSGIAVKQYAKRNKSYLENKLGRPVGGAELYLAHQQGAGGAAALLENPEANVVDALVNGTAEYRGNRAKAERAVALNGGRIDMTAGEFASKWINKYNMGADAGMTAYIPPAKKMSLLNAAKAELGRNIQGEFAELEKAVNVGGAVPRENFDALIQKSLLLDDGQTAEKIRQYANNSQNIALFAGKNTIEQNMQIAGLQEEIASGKVENAPLLGALQKVMQDKKTAIEKDPFTYYAQTGLIQPTAELDFTSPQVNGDVLMQEMTERRAAVDAITAFERGQVSPPVLSDSEITSIKTDFDRGEPRLFADKMQALRSTLMPQELAKVAYAAGKKDSVLGAVIASEPLVSQRIMEGKSVKLPIDYKELKADFDAEISTMKIPPSQITPMFETAKAYYNFLHASKDPANTSIDDDDLAMAITDVYGKPIDTDYGKIFSFKVGDRTLEEDDVNDMLDDLTDEQIMQAAGELPIYNGKPRSIEFYRGNMQLRSAGSGKYLLYMDEAPLLNASQEPFMLDLAKIAGGL